MSHLHNAVDNVICLLLTPYSPWMVHADTESPVKPGSIAVLRKRIPTHNIPGGVKCTVTEANDRLGFYRIDIDESDTLLNVEFSELKVSSMALLFLKNDKVPGVPTYTTPVHSAEELITYNVKYNQAALTSGIQDVVSLQAPRPGPFQSSMKGSQKLCPEYSLYLQKKERSVLSCLQNLKDNLSHCTKFMLWELTYTDEEEDDSVLGMEGKGEGV